MNQELLDIYDELKTEPFPVTMQTFDKFVSGVYDRVVRRGMHSLFLRKDPKRRRGGISRTDIDQMQAFPYIRTVSVEGLDQDTFTYFVRTYGEQLRAIRFRDCRRVEDWSCLAELPQIEFLYFEGNSHVTGLWDVSRNKFLQGLFLEGCAGLQSLEGLCQARALKYFVLTDKDPRTGERVRMALTSLESMKGATIKRMSLDVARMDAPTPELLDYLPYLRELDFPLHLLNAETVAEIQANFPKLTVKFPSGVAK